MRHGDQVSPAFLEATVQQENIRGLRHFSGRKFDGQEGVVEAFLRIAPAMMFVRYCAGDQGWHAIHQYANLTIDDPWLRQPYGDVDYQGLLEAMQKHNFHTTIAFIPWNYDRNEPGVISLFKEHPDKFSITVHGNNHDHKEFTDFRSKPLAVQIADMKQSLARMETFRTLTGIPYDRVMVFPHSIAPEGTLGRSRLTIIWRPSTRRMSLRVLSRPTDLSFALRPVTLSFGGLPSVSRYSAAAPISKSYIAINEFLGNPLLFYDMLKILPKAAMSSMAWRTR